MIWILLRTFLAWGSARLIKKKILKTDFNKPTAIILAIVWGGIWGIVAAYTFEYIFGIGTFRSRALVLSILFTSIAAYYALIAKDFEDSPKQDMGSNNTKDLERPIVQKKHIKGDFFRKIILVKSGIRSLISLIVIIVLFLLTLATNTIIVKDEWLIAHQEFIDTSAFVNAPLCQKVLNNQKISELDLTVIAEGPRRTEFMNLIEELLNCKADPIGFCVNEDSIFRGMACIASDDPGSLIDFSLNSLKNSNLAIPWLLFSGILAFTLLLAGRVLILERKLGWKRLSIVLGGAIAIVLAIIITLLADGFDNQYEVIISILFSLILTPCITIILVLKGRSLFEWVKEGFSK